MAVYLIHFERRYYHAGHYLGYSADVAARLRLHRNNEGARLLQVVNQVGIDWQVVRVWAMGDYALEQALKARRNGSRLCPVCVPPQQAAMSLQDRFLLATLVKQSEVGGLAVEGFHAWLLAQPGQAVVGMADEIERGPLACWLAATLGGVWRVDAATVQTRTTAGGAWSERSALPPWAIAFVHWLGEQCGCGWVTREQALAVLHWTLADLARWHNEQGSTLVPVFFEEVI